MGENKTQKEDYSTITFVSRNKDNRDLPNFKERTKSFLSNKPLSELRNEFEEFVEEGIVDEVSRFYVSVNKRNIEKANKKLIHFLIDNPSFPPHKIQSKLVSLASQKDCALESKWLFDFDSDNFQMLLSFVKEVEQYTPVEWSHTRTGFAVVAEHGFDTRRLLNEWENIELHRDGELLVASGTRNY